LASDGTASVAEILEVVARVGFLDVIAITDHERIDAAVAARTMAADLGLPVEVVVGEEITTRGGHLVGLFLECRVPPLRSLRWSIEAIHDQGGIAIPAHPLVPLHLSAQGWMLERLLGDDNRAVHPDGIETFNPTAIGRYGHRRSVEFAVRHGLPQLGSSDAHAALSVGSAWTTYPGHSAADLRMAILAGATTHHGTFHGSVGQLRTFGQQLRKRSRDARAEVTGRIRRDGTGRDHGYPGGTQRPPAFDGTTSTPVDDEGAR
ncbi:MAG: PHP-associated domain-containing protein, partial [Candidatus Limnocylindrales bacterium]